MRVPDLDWTDLADRWFGDSDVGDRSGSNHSRHPVADRSVIKGEQKI